MITRRLLLKSGSMAMLSLGFAPHFLGRAAAATSGSRKLLIALFQRGAVDGLNMVIPYGESEYYRLRPTIAIDRPGAAGNGAIDLDGFFGLHPQMAALKPFWDNGSLAVVHACGSPARTRSHFDAQDYMETATPDVKSTRDGWLNRYLQQSAAERSPLRGVALGRQMPRALQGAAPSLAVGSLDSFVVRGTEGGALERAWERSGDSLLGAAGRDAFEAMRVLRTSGADRRGRAVYPQSPFGRALQQIAQLATADVGLEVAFAESTNWDHHANEGGAEGQLANRLTDFSASIAALVADLGERMADTVIVTMSEFGRTVAENGSRGTDHGHGNAMMVIGGAVRGKRVVGHWPGLAREQRFEGRDLAVTTDFRDVFGEIAARHLNVPADALGRIFPGHTPSAPLGLVTG